MSKCKWMPLYVRDYIVDTMHLSVEEHGAYLLLIMHYWMTGCLPKADASLARIARMSLYQWNAHRAVIATFFDADWRHKRIDAEIAAYQEIRKANSENGRRGGEAKALKTHDAQLANATISPAFRYTPTPLEERVSTSVASAPDLFALPSKSDCSEILSSQSSSKLKFRRIPWKADSFEKFWQTYPRKVGKEAARKAFERIHRSGNISYADLMTAVERFAADPGCDPEYIPHPTTWLNQGRFLDERLQKPVAKGMTEVVRSKRFFEPLCSRYREENGGTEPPATPDGALLPTKWVNIASEADDERSARLLSASDGIRQGQGTSGRGVSRH